MKKLMMTTAIVAVTSFGAMAQTAPEATAPATQGQVQGQAQGQMNVPAFLASDFTGMNLYTLDHESVRDLRAREGAAPGAATDTGAATGTQTGHTGLGYQDRSVRWTSSDAFMTQRDAWDNIGNIDDVVMTQDGEIRGVIVDVGGFLGLFAHTVMVDIDDLYFVADDAAAADGTTGGDVRDFYVVASMSREQLEALPEWDEAQLTTGFEARSYGQQPGAAQQGMDQSGVAPAEGQAEMMEPGQTDTTMQDDTLQGQPQTDMATDFTTQGYTEVDATDERTVEALTGANVYDAAEDNIGNVTDLVLAGDNSVTHLLVDVGGFLGMGSHTVALPVEDVNILWHDQNNDVRVHVRMTREQLETLPEHQG